MTVNKPSPSLRFMKLGTALEMAMAGLWHCFSPLYDKPS